MPHRTIGAVAAAQQSATAGVRAAWQNVNNLQARAAETFAGMAPGGGAGMFIVGFMEGVNIGVEMGWGALTGIGHGFAMMGNAVTFHQIDSLDSYVDGLIEDNGGAYGVANFSAHVGVYAAELAALLYVAGALPQFTVMVGRTPVAQQSHVIYNAGGPWLHAMGRHFGRMRVVTMTTDDVIEFAAGRILTLRLPILFPSAACGLAGERAFSCVTNAAHAFLRGWIPFI